MADEKINQLIRQYKESGDIAIRNQIAERYLYIADILAKKFVGRGVDKINNQPVILSEVELLRVEPWRTSKSASLQAKRDLVTTLGDFLTECYIRIGEPPKLVRRSLRRYRSSVSPRSSLGETSTTLRMTYSGKLS